MGAFLQWMVGDRMTRDSDRLVVIAEHPGRFDDDMGSVQRHGVDRATVGYQPRQVLTRKELVAIEPGKGAGNIGGLPVTALDQQLRCASYLYRKILDIGVHLRCSGNNPTQR